MGLLKFALFDDAAPPDEFSLAACVDCGLVFYDAPFNAGRRAKPGWRESASGPVIRHLEHAADPAAVLDEAARRLEPGEPLRLETPDASAYAFDAPFRHFQPERLNHFSPAALESLLRGGGFRILAMERAVLKSADGRAGSAVIRASARFEGRGEPAAPKFSAAAQEGPARVEAYLAWSRKHLVMELLSALAAGQRPLWIWGISPLTMLLLGATPLGRARLCGLVDADPAKQGRRLLGRPVQAPESLGGRPLEEGLLLADWGREAAPRRRLKELDFGGPVWSLSEFL